jgi:hypothetical protein
MAVLDREALLSAREGVYETVDIPELGGDVRIRRITGGERDKWDKRISDPNTGRVIPGKYLSARAYLLAVSVVDEDGESALTEDEAKKFMEIQDVVGIDKLFDACMKHSALTKEAQTELAGNSEGIPSGNSTSE